MIARPSLIAALALAALLGCSGEVTEGEAMEETAPATEQELEGTFGFAATANARVERAAPSTVFSDSGRLASDGSPTIHSYLRFEVGGLTRDVQSAKLRLYPVDPTRDGPALYAAADTWSESTITWASKPATVGSALDDKAAIKRYSWVDYDVTTLVRGNGTFSFALVPTSSDGVDFHSRRAAYPPRLIVTLVTAAPAAACGDDACNGDESCATCPADCTCPPPPAGAVCGDSACNGGETCATCPADCTCAPVSDALAVSHDATRGRITLENSVLKLEFGYKTEPVTHNNQGGGNLYYYFDKRYSTQNIISVYEGGDSKTKAYASGAGGIGSTQIYAAPQLSNVTSADYDWALADNGADGVVRSAPVITKLADGGIKLVFDVAVVNKDWAPSYEWYTVLKTWTISPKGRIALRQDWRISKDGYFSEPAVRNQVSTMFKTISRWGHYWDDDVAGVPGTNSRLNPANRWYDWVPNPASVQECNAPTGSGGSQDAVHADYNRFHEGASFDFWFWPDNGGRGFESLGQYAIGYKAFGQSVNSTVNEICHHNRTSIGDGSDAYNLGVMGWWGGDGAPADRFKPLSAGTTWTDSYQMEARPRSATFPADVAVPSDPPAPPPPTDPTEPPPTEPPAPPAPPPADSDTKFSFAVIPDTQNETAYQPSLFNNRMQWLVANKASLDLRFVMHVGDMMDWDTPDHLFASRASAGMKILDDGRIPYAIALGNHDTAAVCEGGSACPGDTHANVRITTTYNSFFPSSRFTALRGSYEPSKMDNAFHTFSAGGVDWLVLNLELWARAPIVAWAKSVVQNHPKHNVIIVTHSHLTSTGTISTSNGGYGDSSPQYVFDQVAKPFANVRLVFSGHTGTTARRQDVGLNGNTIHQILNCYHDGSANPTRLVEIDTANGTLRTWVYSPSSGATKSDGSSFTLTGMDFVRP